MNTFLDISYDDTGKIYPITLDPNTGNLFPAAGNNSPIDGEHGIYAAAQSWASITGAANANTLQPTVASGQAGFLNDDGTNFTYMIRTAYCYDTSGIGAGNQADVASTTLYGTGAAELDNHGQNLVMVDFNPATTTAALITTDYASTTVDGGTGYENTAISSNVTYAFKLKC